MIAKEASLVGCKNQKPVLQLTFAYKIRNEQIDIELLKQRSVKKRTYASDPIRGYEGQYGSWFVITD